MREAAGTSKKLAEQLLAKRKAEILDGKFDVNRPDAILFTEFAGEFLEYANTTKKERTHRFHKNSLVALNKFFGESYLGKITPYEIEQFKLNRLSEVSPSSVNRELATLNHIFNMAIKWEKARENPVEKVQKLKEPPGKIRYLSADEIKILIEHCTIPYLRIAVLISVHTGMRKGEVLALQKKDINFDNQMISVEETKSDGKREDSPKSGKCRYIPINNTLYQELKDWIDKLDGEDILPVDDFRKAFNTAKKDAGLSDISFHTLRHTAASHLVMGGVDLITVKEVLGHESLKMVERYSHLSPDHRRRAMDILQNQISNTVKFGKVECTNWIDNHAIFSIKLH